MKKEKLNLEEIQIDSFVTTIDEKEKRTVEGGESAFLCLSIGVSISFLVTTIKDYIRDTQHDLDKAQSQPAYLCMGTRDPNATPCPATPYQTKYAQYGCPQGAGTVAGA